MPVRGRTTVRVSRWRSFGLVALLGASLCVPTAFRLDATTSGFARASIPSPVHDAEWGIPTVSVFPGSWTMMAGASAAFQANVASVPANCGLLSVSYRWNLRAASIPSGLLNRSAGPSVTFTAYEGAEGPTELEADATILLECLDGTTAYTVLGTTSITVLPALQPLDVRALPNPITPGGSGTIEWTLQGGLAPYSAVVDFGDGNRTTLYYAEPGNGSVAHRFLDGIYTPSVAVTDSLGDRATSSLPDPLVVTAALSAVIDAPSADVDVNRSFTANVSVGGGVAPYLVTWRSSQGGEHWGGNWTLEPSAVGNLTLTVSVLDGAGVVFGASRVFAVEPLPRLVALGANGVGDVGVPFPVRFSISGGVDPFHVEGVFGSSSSASSLLAPGPGAYVVPLVGSAEGPAWVTINLTDRFGAPASTVELWGRIAPLPSLALGGISPVAEVGSRFAVAAAVTNGAPPFNWSVTGSFGVTNGTDSAGSLLADGAFNWSADPGVSGNGTVTIAVWDSAGVLVERNLSVPVLPLLAVGLAMASSVPRADVPVGVLGSVRGGLAPYAYSFRVATRPAGSGSLSNAGLLQLTFTPPTPGFVSLELVVTDAAGVARSASMTAWIEPGSGPGGSGNGTGAGAPALSAPGSAWAVGLGLLASLGGVLLFRRLRPRLGPRPAPTSGTPAMTVVRRLLKEATGLDLETLVLLAEDEGVPPDATRLAVERWTRAGRVVSEPDNGGGEFVEWVDVGAPRRSSETSSSEPP